MFVFDCKYTNPFFNIAMEEFLLKNFDDDFLLMYCNRPSVVVGKHQNTLNEINVRFVHENNIDVVRRISGGGTVYHDEGNLNFSFIQKGEKGKLIDFGKFISHIISALHLFDIQAEANQRNDVLLNGKKISGNAEHIFRNKTLHHATLLYSSELDTLGKALSAKTGKYEDKAIQSVRSRVTSICSEMGNLPPMGEFRSALLSHFLSYFTEIQVFDLQDIHIEKINNLIAEKYHTWEWNYAYSPTYVFRNSIGLDNAPVSVELRVNKGIITEVSLQSEQMELGLLQLVEKNLIHLPHEFSLIKEKLQKAQLPFEVDNELIYSFF